MKRHVDHPDVVRERTIVRAQFPDLTIKHVLVVETKMPISMQDDGFDEGQYNALVEAVRTAVPLVGADEAEIVQVCDPTPTRP